MVPSISVVRLLSCFLLVIVQDTPKCQAGSFSVSSAVSQVASTNYGSLLGRNWLYRIRYDKEANDEIPGSVFDLQDLQDGILRLPPVEIRRVAFYYSRFLERGHDDEDGIGSDPLHLNNINEGNGQVRSFLTLMELLQDDDSTVEDWLAAKEADEGGDGSPPVNATAATTATAMNGQITRDDWGLFSHVYIVVETVDDTFHSIEKFEDYIDVRSSKDPHSVLRYQWGSTGRMERSNAQLAQASGWQSPTAAKAQQLSNQHESKDPANVPEETNRVNHDMNKPSTNLNLNDITPFLEMELQSPYHVTNDNCKHFAKRFWKFVMNDCRGKGCLA